MAPLTIRLPERCPQFRGPSESGTSAYGGMGTLAGRRTAMVDKSRQNPADDKQRIRTPERDKISSMVYIISIDNALEGGTKRH